MLVNLNPGIPKYCCDVGNKNSCVLNGHNQEKSFCRPIVFSVATLDQPI
jgi:hypothetical protein